jgi:hypothetical protein
MGGFAPEALLGLILYVLVMTLITAVILRAAIAFFNAVSGGRHSPSAIPEPSFGKSMGIMLLVMIANAIASIVITMVMGVGAATVGGPPAGINFAAQGGSFVVSLLIMSALLTALLPTTFPRGLLLTLCFGVIAILVGIAIGILAMLIGFSLFR